MIFVILSSSILALLCDDSVPEASPSFADDLDVFDGVDVGAGNVVGITSLGFANADDLLSSSKKLLRSYGAPDPAIDRIELGLLASFGTGFAS